MYSIGNGVFNSNGEFVKYKAPPYGFFVQLKCTKGRNISITLFPFFADNLQTFWCPDFVNDPQFKEVVQFLHDEGSEIERMKICTKTRSLGWELDSLFEP